ncbi:MAG: DUF4296 domain-containing protein [Sphingobacteriia bacterium]|nr:DUF4296 domain-containing protein [Sphingobacteriia bacterium]
MKRSTVLMMMICSSMALAYCRQKDPKEIIPADEMKLILIDLTAATEWNNVLMAKDTALKNVKLNLQFYEGVFEKHHISKEQFYNSYNYYNARPDKMKALLDSTYAYSEKMKNQLIKKKR